LYCIIWYFVTIQVYCMNASSGWKKRYCPIQTDCFYKWFDVRDRLYSLSRVWVAIAGSASFGWVVVKMGMEGKSERASGACSLTKSGEAVSGVGDN
jgi:hypothetical protein